MRISHYEDGTGHDIGNEIRETMRSLIEGGEPTTIMHALIVDKDNPPTRETVAAVLGRPTWQIEMTLAALQENGWLRTYVHNGLEKLSLTVPSDVNQYYH